ncbi:hypothetical protein BN2537_9001 [Streptomyces venezuelae]|nr:hypothetical protein BN2537_9001 [Streptomyces venezuelae]
MQCECPYWAFRDVHPWPGRTRKVSGHPLPPPCPGRLRLPRIHSAFTPAPPLCRCAHIASPPKDSRHHVGAVCAGGGRSAQTAAAPEHEPPRRRPFRSHLPVPVW